MPTHDEIMAQIEQLKELVEAGILEKNRLPGLLKAIYSGCQDFKVTKGKASDQDAGKRLGEKALQSHKFRSRRSPETLMIRSIITVPMNNRLIASF